MVDLAAWAAAPEAPLVHDLTTTVVSCQQRNTARSLTIPQLEAAELTPRVILSPCNPAGGRQNAIAASEALQAALGARTDLLYCEDDIDLTPGAFTRMLNLARAHPATLTYLYAHDGNNAALTYPPGVLNKLEAREWTPQLVQSRTAKVAGAQCTYIPRQVLTELDIPTLQAGRNPIDIFLVHHMLTRDLTPLVAVPHPVQHRRDRTAREPDYPKAHKRSDTNRYWTNGGN